MRQELQISLAKRLLDLIERRTTDMVDAQSSAPVAEYLDPVRHAREVETLYRRWPLIVGHSSKLAAVGDYFTHDASGLPLLLVRGGDGRARAFFNVCRHRGARVVCEAAGAGKTSFVCPYHSWTYKLDGRLAGIPHAEGFPEIEPARQGLVELPMEEYAGFLWVVPTPGASIDVASTLGPAADDLKALNVSTHTVYESRQFDRALNWKLAFDIFLEGYHVRPAHAQTIAPVFLDNVGLYDSLGWHLRIVFPKRSLSELRGQDPAGWNLRAHANVLYVIFPNTALLVQPDHLSVMHSFPLGPAATRVVAYTLTPEPATSDKARRHWDANNALFYAAIEEDYAMGESIQSGLGSGANAALTFGRFEQALGLFHRNVERALTDSV
ncbi:MAG TPA: SRPBCC family protein [Pirellulales bacterium]|jgi:phenylpropionate dioxygenase-like ring-hydroxylating dioxygenase large terminal subunit